MSLQMPGHRERELLVFFFHFLDTVLTHMGDTERNGFFHVFDGMELRHSHQRDLLMIRGLLPRCFDPLHDMS